MASNKNRRAARVTPNGSNAMGIQKKINTDYAMLARDYEKLGVELWRKPITKYILGGIALTVLVPFLTRAYDNFPEINTFVKDNIKGLRTKIDGLINSDDMDALV